ncbi:MAG: hypothetical protein HUJ91_04065 [Bacteroidales bacterium]|nr:hypothetical protein [Bacteroidales bacterium]
MRKRIFILLALGVLTVLPSGVSAQSSQTVVHSEMDERLQWNDIWLTSANPAAVGGVRSLLDTTRSVSEAMLALKGAAGECRDVYTPQSEFSGEVSTRSYMTLGKVVAGGSFSYGYGRSQGSTWRGLINPRQTPFMLADSIPGTLTNETYRMSAVVSSPLGNHFEWGLKGEYAVCQMAKQVDLRNRNGAMDFCVTPGIRYSSPNFDVGLALKYSRSTEKIEYMQVDASGEKYLFEFMGAWIYRSMGFSSAETSRMKIDNSVGASLQMEWKMRGGKSLYNELSSDYSESVQSETGYNNLHHGTSRTLVLGDRLAFVVSPKSRIVLSLQSSPVLGYRYAQRQELDPASGIRRYVTYGSAVPCYMRQDFEGSLFYDMCPPMFRDGTGFGWALSAGCIYESMYESYILGNERLGSEQWNMVRPSVKLEVGFETGKASRLDIGLQASPCIGVEPQAEAAPMGASVHFEGTYDAADLRKRQYNAAHAHRGGTYLQWSIRNVNLRMDASGALFNDGGATAVRGTGVFSVIYSF